ncbi:MAG: YbdD/YjiX family protein [Intrasporangium sp.]|uniref:YbdD/YjiX family protein n=1 Tax=Intrasporangium sp. TaxID=1925024 RepID=UPI00264829F2|nr:YbdD/YjiX family protein [Intrasporangium sp.]MDN5797418.1 YbdD/YjiX family protein [Intrasporangium sp.]
MPVLAPATLSMVLHCARDGGRRAARYLRAVMGADAYERYCAHLAVHDPGAEPMNERQFWREHFDWQDRNPQGRCC